MSRSGFVDSDGENDLAIYGWQANARRMMRGKPGQSFLWELYLSLEALPKKELITGGLVDEDGACCALGAVALRRGIEIPDDLKVRRNEDGDIDEDDADDFYQYVTPLLKIKEMMAREVMYENDEGDQWHWPDGRVCHSLAYKDRDAPIRRYDLPHERWQRLRRWVVSRLRGIP